VRTLISAWYQTRPLRAGSPRGPVGYLDGVEGGISIFLFLLIVVGAGIGGVLLFGSGGYLRKKQLDGELGGDGSDAERPTHMRVEDDSNATQDVPSPTPTVSGAGERPPPPPE
jgi:hypothetical protein